MAAELMMQVKCDRCERLETRPVSKDLAAIQAGAATAQFKGSLRDLDGTQVNVEIGDLCGPCLATVTKHLEAIGKKVEKASPNRSTK